MASKTYLPASAVSMNKALNKNQKASWAPSSFKIVSGTIPTSSSKSNASSSLGGASWKPSDYGSLLSQYGYSSGGSGYSMPSIARADYSGVYNALAQKRDAANKMAQDTYNNTRSDLLTSLKRFQEQNARDVENQKSSFTSNQAALESARAEADRQNRISAAARGIGGSGLQQLAQLQNLISQGQDISNLATENQSAMDTLKRALNEQEEDTNTNLARALQTYNNAVNANNSDYANTVAEYEAKAEADYINALNSARASAAAASANGSSTNANLATLLQNYEDQYKNSLGSLSNISKKDWNNNYKKTYGKYSKENIAKAQTALNQASYNDIVNNVASLTDYYNLSPQIYNQFKSNLLKYR